jgi:hypothetical protein
VVHCDEKELVEYRENNEDHSVRDFHENVNLIIFSLPLNKTL